MISLRKRGAFPWPGLPTERPMSPRLLPLIGLGLCIAGGVAWWLAPPHPAAEPTSKSANEVKPAPSPHALPETPLASKDSFARSSQAARTHRSEVAPAVGASSPEEAAESTEDRGEDEGEEVTEEAEECRRDTDCPVQSGCLRNPETGRRECLPSECENDGQCAPGHACRAVVTHSSGLFHPPVRRCLVVGVRKLGERCLPETTEVGTSCGAELFCALGRCGPLCAADGGTCPPGTACINVLPHGRVCVPSCREGECPRGQTCAHLSPELSLCATTTGQDCVANPCPTGQECQISRIKDWIGYHCALPCNADTRTGCPEGYACDRYGECLRACNPKRPGSCGEQEECVSLTDDEGLWGCRPDR